MFPFFVFCALLFFVICVRLVAQWQCIGWCHGVLNTDNMSIIADTIDYGPFGFMEIYDPHYVCNASDHTVRCCFHVGATSKHWHSLFSTLF